MVRVHRFRNPRTGRKFPAFPLDSTGAALIRYIQFQDNKFKKHVSMQQLEALLMSYSGREKDLAEDINQSIAAGYRSVYPKAKANLPKTNGQAPPQKPSVSATESMHPALVAQRKREEKENVRRYGRRRRG